MIHRSGRTPPLTEKQIGQVRQFMYDVCGIDLNDKAYLINSKIGSLMFRLRISSFDDFWHRAMTPDAAGDELRYTIVDHLTTHYSYFWREERHFTYMKRLIREKKLPCSASEDGICRVWSAGCSTGQETYNIAMLLEDASREGILTGSYEVIGSDISRRAVREACKGHYDMTDYVRLPAPWRGGYMFHIPGGCEVKPKLRQTVQFRVENLLDPAPSKPYDLIFCRNVMIYLDSISQRRAFEVFRRSLLPGGYLFLGHTELMWDIPGFTYIDPSVYQKTGGAP